jgi:hypothetical protein
MFVFLEGDVLFILYLFILHFPSHFSYVMFQNHMYTCKQRDYRCCRASVCVMGVGERNRMREEFPGCVKDVVSVVDVTSLPFLRRLALLGEFL